MGRVVLLSLLVARAALAHDFWIEPSTFRPQAGELVTVGLRVGQQFVGDAVARDSQLIERFTFADAGGERPIGGIEGRDPAGYLRLEQQQAAVIVYRSRPKFLELPPEKFEQYLRDEGLERVIADRARRGESARPSREIYSRCAKSLLNSDRSARLFRRALGLRFEIVPEDGVGADRMVFRLLYESHPLEGALVVAMHRDDPALRLSIRSDRNGRVKFHLPRNGVWLIKSVHMVRAPAVSNADWESLWASLTFER